MISSKFYLKIIIFIITLNIYIELKLPSMPFNFIKNIHKNFVFIKKIEDDTELLLTSIKLDNKNNEYLVPIGIGNINNEQVNEKYLSDDSVLKFKYVSKYTDLSGGLVLQLNKDDSSRIIIDEFNLLDNISKEEFNTAISAITIWCQTILLATNIDYLPGKEYSHQEEPYKKPKELILTAGPLVSHFENIYTHDAVNNGWNTEWSKYLDKFEANFSDFIGSKYALSTSSCTGALFLSLLACGIEKGDEVILPELTWVATASAVRYTGATPVFADVDLKTWCLDTQHLENLLTERTKAIMPVHLYGNPSDMKTIMEFAKKHNLKVIEDAAPAIGATYDDKKVGSFGDFGCFSFQGAKLLVTGEGGMVVTDNEDLFSKFKKLWDHGRTPGTFWIDELGYKFKMSNLQAAFGLGQLENIDLLIEAKKRNYQRYRNNLSSLDNITLNEAGENTESIYWMTSLLLNPHLDIKRDELAQELREAQIDTRPVFPSISQYPIWEKKYEENKNSKIIAENALNLPSGVGLSSNEIDYISDTLIRILQKS
tara:strand:- start:10539 stop:12158 length:1620 start_codon:yes stop_codon:yes gene_type:complete